MSSIAIVNGLSIDCQWFYEVFLFMNDQVEAPIQMLSIYMWIRQFQKFLIQFQGFV